MSRHVDGHTFESLGRPCTRCGLPEERYDDRPRACEGLRASSSFVLPENVDPKAISADAKDGVLRIHVPKAKNQTTKPLAIEVHRVRRN